MWIESWQERKASAQVWLVFPPSQKRVSVYTYAHAHAQTFKFGVKKIGVLNKNEH